VPPLNPVFQFVDGYEHETTTPTAQGFGSNYQLAFSATGSPTFVAGHNGYGKAVSLSSASAQVIERRWTTAGTTDWVFSGYFRVAGAVSASRAIIHDCGIGGSGMGFYVNASGVCEMGCDSNSRIGSVFIADGNWHLLDWWCDTAVNPWVMRWRVDEVDQPLLTGPHAAQVAGDAQYRLGHAAAGNGISEDWDDCVMSGRKEDYPIGPHRNYWLEPNADGSHNLSGSIRGDAGETTNLYQKVQDWPANQTDYIKQDVNAGGAFAEIMFDDLPAVPTNVLGVMGYMAGFASATTPATTGASWRLVWPDGTDIGGNNSLDMSESATHYRCDGKNGPAGGPWTVDQVNSIRARVGYCTDVTANPRWTALALAVCVEDRHPLTIPDRSGNMSFAGGR